MNLEQYEKLLLLTLENYTCVAFRDYFSKYHKNGTEEGDRFCLLRHDIDFSPENALRMAEIENKYGVSSTYTVLLGGEHYSPFVKRNRNVLKKICDLGHEVGLHFDPTDYDLENEEALDLSISKESRILEELVEVPVKMFSFHNTTQFSMSCRAPSYGGLLNAYSEFFHSKVDYTSDSNGYWRFRTWTETLKEDAPLIQILTHPIWWRSHNNLEPFETVVRECYERYMKRVLEYAEVFSNQSDRENKSFLGDYVNDKLEGNNADLLVKYAKYEPLLESLFDASLDKNSRSMIARKFLEDVV